MFVKRNNDFKKVVEGRWIIPTAVNKQRLWASTQGAKYTDVIRLAPTTSTLSFPLLTVIWWHSTHSENSLVPFAYVFSVQFSRSVVSDSLWPQQKQLPMGPLSHLVPPAAWLHWSLNVPTTWPRHGLQCLSLSLQAVNMIKFVLLNLFLFSSWNHTRPTISWKMQNTLKWFHKMFIYCTQWHSKSRLTLAWNRSQASWRPWVSNRGRHTRWESFSTGPAEVSLPPEYPLYLQTSGTTLYYLNHLP